MTRIRVVLFVALIVAPLAIVAGVSTRLFTPGGRFLEIDLRAKGGRLAQIFWSDDFTMSHSASSVAPLHQQGDSFETLRFPLPQKPLEVLRFDPLDGEGEVVIRSLRILDERRRVVRTIDPNVLGPLHQIASIRPEGNDLHVITTPRADDPMLVTKASWLAESPRWYNLQFVTPMSLAWIAMAVVVLIATGLGFIVREIRAGPFSRRDALWLLALLLTVVWAKLALLHQYPVPVPFWDQWDGEALPLYMPWADHGVTWRQMFTFHNEHRIFFSRVLALSLLILNGQWDPHLQIVVNSLLHSIAALVFAAILWLALGRRHLPGIVLAVALTFAPPFGIENTLAGFQSAFYFLVLFSALALWLMGTSQPGTARWFLGCFLAMCCPFTVAGGILILPPIALVLALRAVNERWGWRPIAVCVVALLAVAAVGYGALPPPVGGHEVLKAKTFLDFRVALTRSLAFPWINYPRATALMWLPLAVMALMIVRRRLHTTASERITLALGAWVVLQCAAMAYSRGAGGAAPASRYLDVVAFGYLANTAVILSWLKPQNSRRLAIACAVGLVAWISVTGLGIKRVSGEALAVHGPLRRLWTREHIRNVRQFLINDDAAAVLAMKGPRDIPYHTPNLLVSWLENPYIRRILPAAVRQPLELQRQPASVEGGILNPINPQPVFDSYSSAGAGEVRFESAPVSCQALHHIRFEVASSASWSGLQLKLQSVNSGEETPIRPPWLARGGWRSIVVRCPDGPFKVVAVDASPTSWLAFRQVSEIALGSSFAETIVQQSRFIGLAAIGVLVLALATTVRAWRSHAPILETAPATPNGGLR